MGPQFPKLTPSDWRQLARDTVTHTNPNAPAPNPNGFNIVAFCKKHDCSMAELFAFCFIGMSTLGFHNIAGKIIDRHRHSTIRTPLATSSFHPEDDVVRAMSKITLERAHALHALAAAPKAHETVESEYRSNTRTVLAVMNEMVTAHPPGHALAVARQQFSQTVDDARKIAVQGGQFAFLQEIKDFEAAAKEGRPPRSPGGGSPVTYLVPRS